MILASEALKGERKIPASHVVSGTDQIVDGEGDSWLVATVSSGAALTTLALASQEEPLELRNDQQVVVRQ